MYMIRQRWRATARHDRSVVSIVGGVPASTQQPQLAAFGENDEFTGGQLSSENCGCVVGYPSIKRFMEGYAPIARYFAEALVGIDDAPRLVGDRDDGV